MRLRRLFLLGAALALALGHATPSAALSLGFDCITHNLAGDCAIGEAQLTVDVSNPGNGKVDFAFHNIGLEASSITDVYWDDDNLLSFLSITDTPGVEFSQGANPGNVPGASGASPKFHATRGLTSDSEPPTMPNGVNPGEVLLIRLKLRNGNTYADAIQDLEDGSLRIAIHVQGFTSSGSESFVNAPVQTEPIPEPGTLSLVAAGTLALTIARRRRA
jgi:hypothetical protein